MSRFDVIAFDADDTLWQNEHLFLEAQARFKALLAQYHSPEWVGARLYETEVRNMQHYGYGIKAFALSMIETALDLTEDRVSGVDVRAILDTARAMLTAHVELVENVADTVAALATSYPLMVITKGDLRDQHAKMARSGLAGHFAHVEVVSEKNTATYERVLTRHRIPAERFLMVGNSLKSDVLPVLALGGTAVYVPHQLTWAHEAAAAPPAGTHRYYEIRHVGLLPGLLTTLEGDR
jgi:putative hydrolase of the HAD superfamily